MSNISLHVNELWQTKAVFTPWLFLLSNHLLSWHFTELWDDITPQYSLMSSSLFNAIGYPIKRSPDKVSCTCTPRNTPQWFQRALCQIQQKRNKNLQSYFEMGSLIRYSSFTDVPDLWCSRLCFTIFSLWCMIYCASQKSACSIQKHSLTGFL